MIKKSIATHAAPPNNEDEMLETLRALTAEDSEDDTGPSELVDSSDDEVEDVYEVIEDSDSDDDDTPGGGVTYGCCNLEAPRMQDILACDIVFPTEVYNTGVVQKEYVDVEVILDSGAGAHVAARKHIPGCQVRDSELKRAGASFVAIDGGRIENEGEAEINLVVIDGNGGEHKVRTTVQVADVTRALWSVGVLCDAGLDPRFTAKHAKIFDKKGVELCHFERKNGLYVATVKLRNPEFQGFQRQAS
jgi:hypothetical protein